MTTKDIEERKIENYGKQIAGLIKDIDDDYQGNLFEVIGDTLITDLDRSNKEQSISVMFLQMARYIGIKERVKK